MVERGRNVERTGPHEADIRRRVGVLREVDRRPDDPDDMNAGQPDARRRAGAVQYLVNLIGPVPAQTDHRSDARRQDPGGRFVDHDLVGA